MQKSNENKYNAHQKSGDVIISNEVRDYGNEPFFVKKADDSKKFLEEHGFPEAFIKHKIEHYTNLLKKGS